MKLLMLGIHPFKPMENGNMHKGSCTAMQMANLEYLKSLQFTKLKRLAIQTMQLWMVSKFNSSKSVTKRSRGYLLLVF